jgi:hypothetical protein
MTTLSEHIEHAADALPQEQKQQLVRFLLTQLGPSGGVTAPVTPSPQRHRILDIQPVHLGAVLQPLTRCDDLLGEMLEGRT